MDLNVNGWYRTDAVVPRYGEETVNKKILKKRKKLKKKKEESCYLFFQSKEYLAEPHPLVAFCSLC